MLRHCKVALMGLLGSVMAFQPVITPIAEHWLYEDIEQEAYSTHYYSIFVTDDYYEAGK